MFNKEQVIGFLQEDLKNERKHMMYYLQAGVMVRGLHREEFSELFLKEAQDEHNHVVEFSRLIVQLGGIPSQEINEFPTHLTLPEEIIAYAVEMEQLVANNYALRMSQIDPQDGGIAAYVNLFYEDQLQDSQKTALELKLYIQNVLHNNNL
jgi:bacterioferritin (cytochrome b1)